MTIARQPGGGGRRRRLGAAVLLAAAMFAAAGATPVAAADDDPEPSPGTDEGDEGCTDQQKEGGYEEIDGRCQLTGWNWGIGNPCLHDAEIGRLGDTSACDGPGGGGDGPGPVGPGQPGGDDGSDGFDDFDEFDTWCTDQGGQLSTGDPASGYQVHTCSRDGAVFGLCSAFAVEDDEEPFLECLVLPDDDTEPLNEFPVPPSTTPAGPLERPAGGVDDVAGPVDEPSEPGGPVVTVDVTTGVVLSDVTAGAGGDDVAGADEEAEPEPTTVTAATTSDFDILDVLVASPAVEEAGDEG